MFVKYLVNLVGVHALSSGVPRHYMDASERSKALYGCFVSVSWGSYTFCDRLCSQTLGTAGHVHLGASLCNLAQKVLIIYIYIIMYMYIHI